MFMLNSNERIKVAQLQKLANQSMLDGALAIGMLTILLSKKNFDKARSIPIEKNRYMGSEKYISTRFR